MERRRKHTSSAKIKELLRSTLIAVVVSIALLVLTTQNPIPTIPRKSFVKELKEPKKEAKPKAPAIPLCKSNRSDNPFLYKVWRVLETSPQLQLRVAGGLSKPSQKSAEREALVTNQELFLDRSGHWLRALRSNAEPELGIPATLDFPADMVPLLPPRDRNWQFGTCAVVANSGVLLNKTFGHQIDSRDAVFRVNRAPTIGFEQYVGSKTTFDIINQQHAKVKAEVNGHSGSMPESKEEARNSTIVVFEVTSNWSRRHLYVPLLTKLQAAGSDVAVLSPALVVHAYRTWARFGQGLEAAKIFSAKKMLKPMSGFFAIVFSLQVCENVHLYGFSPFKADSVAPYHYFDSVQGVTKHHAFDASFELFKLMSKWPCAEAKVYIH